MISLGHSSAATHALMLGAVEPKVSQVVAFAPPLDIAKFHGPDMTKALREGDESYARFVDWASPGRHLKRQRAPLFLFVAEDDSVSSAADVISFARRLGELGRYGTLDVVPTGDHYDAMVSTGIGHAIEWTRRCRSARPETCGTFLTGAASR